MKISELVKKTGVSKETIHYYIREGVLPKPRKTGRNSADYNEDYIEQIRTIKALRENYYLPIPVIKKLLARYKKSSRSERSAFRFLSEYFRPLDRLVVGEVTGKRAFMEATGLSEKWLDRMEKWGVITSCKRDGKDFYSQDDVIIGKLLVDMDRIGIGPADGFDPIELKHFTDLFRQLVAKNIKRYMTAGWDRLSPEELRTKGAQATEVMSLFFYHIYRKVVREEYLDYVQSQPKKDDDPGDSRG